MTRSLRMGCLLLPLCVATSMAAAQDAYPTKPIRLVVGFTAGGPTDVPARMVAQKLRESLGQPVVVENKPGAGGKIALDFVLKQPRDGYTLSLCTYIDVTNTVLMKDPGYTLADIEPIAQITQAYYAFAVPSALPVSDARAFVAHAKKNPAKLNYGHVGAGSMPELVARRFERAAGITMTGIPYKGTAEAARDLVAGRLDFMVSPLIVVRPFYEAKSIKYIGMTSPQRLPAFPTVPTLTEQGYSITDNGWLGVCAGAGTPKPIVERLNRAVVTAVESQEYRTLVEKTGVAPYASTPENFRKVVADTHADMVTMARDFAIAPK